MSAQHTPGPWEVGEGGGYVGRVFSANPARLVAQTTVPSGDDLRGHKVTKANARVIAAAPCMLTALDRAEAFIAGFEDDDTQEGIPELLGAIRAALRKAKGE